MFLHPAPCRQPYVRRSWGQSNKIVRDLLLHICVRSLGAIARDQTPTWRHDWFLRDLLHHPSETPMEVHESLPFSQARRALRVTVTLCLTRKHTLSDGHIVAGIEERIDIVLG